MNDPPDEYMITQKDRLNNIIRDFSYLFDPEILTDAVYRVNATDIHTHNVVKGIFLDQFEKDINFPFTNKNHYPKINEKFIRMVMNAITFKLQTKGKPEKKDASYVLINNFANKHYKPLLKEDDLVCRDNLKHILNHEEKMIITNIKNNIKEHYISHLRSFVKIYFNIDHDIDRIIKDKKRKDKKTHLKNIMMILFI